MQHPAIVITQAVIRLCQQNNVAILFCDERHLPISITLPLWDGHSLHTKVLNDQINLGAATRKRLWKEIVKEKIRHQIATLEQAGIESKALHRIRDKVKSGDPENCEAQAARLYWPLLMGRDFRRDQSADGINSLLNYGYTIMRAMIARAIVGTGLHPALGLHHKNQYNGLCLADDLMEPFRAWIDWTAYKLQQHTDEALIISKETKSQFLSLLSSEVFINDKKMPLMVASHFLAANLKAALTEKTPLIYPKRMQDAA